MPGKAGWRRVLGLRRWGIRQGARLLALAGALAAWPALSQPEAPLTLVQPLEAMEAGDVVAEHFRQHLARELGGTVQHHRRVPFRGIDSLRWAAREAPAQSTLVLMPALLYGQLLESEGMGTGDQAWFTPLQSVLHISWCLVAPSRLQLRNYDALHAWLVSLQRPVRLALPGHAGFVRIWSRAMEIKTGLEWEPHIFSHARLGLQALQAGQVDLVAERCHDIFRTREELGAPAVHWQVLLRTGMARALAGVPSFSEWKLPPLSQGWMVWMVPKAMDAQRQQRLANALHAIMARQDTQLLIASHYNHPLPWSREQSVQWVLEQQSNWQGLLEWLDHRPRH